MKTLAKTIAFTICGLSLLGGVVAAAGKPLEGLNLSKLKLPQQVAGAAKGLSLLQVVGVASSSYGDYEYLDRNSRSTSQAHAGNIVVAVLQYGYGNTNAASLNAAEPDDTNTVTFCGSLSNIHNCRAGEKVSGWIYFYQFNQSQGGYFTMSANSTAAPFGTSKVALTIQSKQWH